MGSFGKHSKETHEDKETKIFTMKLFLLLVLVKLTYGIQVCSKINGTIDKKLELKICTSKDYNNRFPSDDFNEMETFVRVFDFVQLDWNENTITIFLQIFSHWNDTRIQLNDKWHFVEMDERAKIFFPK